MLLIHLGPPIYPNKFCFRNFKDYAQIVVKVDDTYLYFGYDWIVNLFWFQIAFRIIKWKVTWDSVLDQTCH